MKTTLELPNDLLREMKLRAVHEGRKFKDVAAEIIRRGLSMPEPPMKSTERRRVKLPIITAPPGAPKFDLTGEDIDRILSEQEVKSANETAGH